MSEQRLIFKKLCYCSAPVAHGCNPSYLGGRDWKDGVSRPSQANTSLYPISKITRAKWTGGMAQVVEHLLCNLKGLSSNSSNLSLCQKNYTFVYAHIHLFIIIS
jgi:hypothetical protein